MPRFCSLLTGPWVSCLHRVSIQGPGGAHLPLGSVPFPPAKLVVSAEAPRSERVLGGPPTMRTCVTLGCPTSHQHPCAEGATAPLECLGPFSQCWGPATAGPPLWSCPADVGCTVGSHGIPLSLHLLALPEGQDFGRISSLLHATFHFKVCKSSVF